MLLNFGKIMNKTKYEKYGGGGGGGGKHVWFFHSGNGE